MNPGTLAIAATSLALLVHGITGAWAQQSREDRVQRLEREISQLKERIESNRESRNRAELELERTEREINRLTIERNALGAKIGATERRIEELDTNARQAEARLPSLKQELSRALVDRYRLSRRAKAAILLDPSEPTQGRRLLTYYDHLIESQTIRIASIREEIEKIAALRGQAETQRSSLARTKEEFAAKADALERVRDTRRRHIEAYVDQLARDTELIAAKREEKDRLQDLVDGINAIRETAPPSAPPPEGEAAPEPAGLAHLKGALQLPAAGSIATRFGQPDPLSGIPSSGIVINTRDGADVRSVSAGQVVYSDWFRGFGLLLVIDHGDGFMSLYGYNKELLYPIGARVDANATVARAGTANGSSQSGVYFEIRHAGGAVDPLEWCRPKAG
jgi:septal ring factor EnvC (AmiA/AmiB activator)